MSICMSLLSTPTIIYNWMWTPPVHHRMGNTDLFWPWSGTANILTAMVYIESHTTSTADGWIYDLFVRLYLTLQPTVPFERQNCRVTLFTHAIYNPLQCCDSDIEWIANSKYRFRQSHGCFYFVKNKWWCTACFLLSTNPIKPNQRKEATNTLTYSKAL